jgi:hypothetical protein
MGIGQNDSNAHRNDRRERILDRLPPLEVGIKHSTMEQKGAAQMDGSQLSKERDREGNPD